jgi:replicative DNA helicase
MYVDGQQIDAVLLRDELKKRDQLEKIRDTEADSIQYLADCMNSVPSSANAAYYAGIVKCKQRERSLITTVEEINKIIEDTVSLPEKIQRVQDLALGLEGDTTDAEFVEAKQAATQVAVDLRDQKDSNLLKTGFRNLDRIIGGVAPGEFCILAGRPSMGKSALMLDIALNMANAGIGSLIFTLEMTENSLLQRAICSLAKVSLVRAKADELEGSQWRRVYQAGLDLADTNLILSKTVATPEQQLALVRRLKQMHNIGIVFIDYVQLMTAGRRIESRQQEITTISRKLKRLAMIEQVPVVVLSQLNRQVESRDKHRPRMSDLRESGSLEQDADVVMFIHREDYYRRNNDPDADKDGMAEVIVAKNRRGPTGIAKLVFLDECVTFVDLAPPVTGDGNV